MSGNPATMEAARRGRKPGAAGASFGAAAPASKRVRKKKPPATAKLMPSKVAAIIPESAYYSQLLDFERRIDLALARKKADIEALKASDSVKQRLRVYVYNTHESQGQGSPEETPGWTLVIYGRLVSGPQQPGGPGPISRSFSELLKSLEVTLDPQQFEGLSGKVSWSLDSHVGPHSDAFEIKRRGSKPCSAKIKLGFNYMPEQYQLSAELAEVVGLQQDTRSRTLRALWSYIKAHGLQSSQNPTMVECDEKLRALFNEPKVGLHTIAQRISSHLGPAAPVELEYTVSINGQSPTHPDCYEIDIEVPATTPPQLTESFLQKLNKDRELDMYNTRITSGVQKINEHRRRRTFFLGFSHSPVDFINSLVASQAQDLRTASGVGSADVEALRKSALFQGKWVEDGVFRYLQKRLASAQ
mmetsp:Transcript_17387/g.48490  ORF Transcript_17387/g.48490 Transcript_17387/m.48490 type:complete len:415 (-) Transcript_17387:333-1577(-)